MFPFRIFMAQYFFVEILDPSGIHMAKLLFGKLVFPMLIWDGSFYNLNSCMYFNVFLDFLFCSISLYTKAALFKLLRLMF